jgi:hypothetical protein
MEVDSQHLRVSIVYCGIGQPKEKFGPKDTFEGMKAFDSQQIINHGWVQT